MSSRRGDLSLRCRERLEAEDAAHQTRKDLSPLGEARKRIKTPQQERRCDDAVAVVAAAFYELDPLCIAPGPQSAIPASHLFQQIKDKRPAFRPLEVDVVEDIVQGTREPLHGIERWLSGLAELDPRRQFHREVAALPGCQAMCLIVARRVDRPAPRICCFMDAH
jgi:N-acetyl-gamma-glutamylphosphate reductase